MLISALNILSAVLAVLAALAWIQSSRAAVLFEGKPVVGPPRNPLSKYGSLPRPAFLYELLPNGDQIELIGTLVLQSKWNRRAAVLAAGAAIVQAAVSLAPVLDAGKPDKPPTVSQSVGKP